MQSLVRLLLSVPLLQPILRPLTRVFVGLIAIPLFRIFSRRVIRLPQLDDELEKDLEQWFRGALLLLVATRNMETVIFGWVNEAWQGENRWLMMGLRVMLAIGVVEAMPDQELFSIIHPGPPKLKFVRTRRFFTQVREQAWPFFRGVLCQHINRSSPVFAILAAVAPGWIGWTCYGLALAQYLIIGLVTSRDKAVDVLLLFDEQVARRRNELIEEFDLDEPVAKGKAASSVDADQAASPNSESSPGVAKSPAADYEKDADAHGATRS